MRSITTTLSMILLGGICLGRAYGDPAPAPAPAAPAAPAGDAASQPAAQGAMKIYITAVSGLVQVRDTDTQPWRAAAPQMLIAEGAELRTGPHSSVTCVIPPDQTFTLDRLGTVKVEEAARHGDKITTDLIMKYGRTHYEIGAAGLEHEASIISPSSTLAVRGTVVTLFDQPPFKPEAISYTGRANFTVGHTTVPVGQKDGTPTRIVSGNDSAADSGLMQSVVDPRDAASLTATDKALFATEVSRGAVLSYDPVANISVVTNSRPSFDSELPAGLPGSLNIVLRWTGNADLNLEVGVSKGDPLTVISNGFSAGEFLYPGYGFQNSASGGHIPYDNRGGPTGGQEIAYWVGTPPAGIYGIAAQFISGATTSFTLDVYLNGIPLNMILLQDDGSLIKSRQYTRTLGPGENFAPIVAIPPTPTINSLATNDPLGNPNPGITAASFGNPVPAQASPALRSASAPKDSLGRPYPVVQIPQKAMGPKK